MSIRKRPSRNRTSLAAPTPTAWITARARNALRRPLFISTVSIVTFAASLMALVVVPRQARKAAAGLRPPAAQRPDTEPTMSALTEAERQVARADSALSASRIELRELVAATAAAMPSDTSIGGDTLNAASHTRRDSLATQAALLTRLLTRAENAPLLGSYRALAEAAPMRGDARAKQLLDSLVEIERERDSYNAVGGVDPVFVALTARANELGRSIQNLAEARRVAIRKEATALEPAPLALPVAIAARPLPDTLARAKSRDTARVVAAEVANRLARERSELQRLDIREERARELDNVGASPSAILAAALVFGAMLGFGVVLLDEVRRPRVADAAEAERATGVRVLGVIRPVAPSPERGRRAADRVAPPYIDPGADGHQLIYLTIAPAGANVVMVTVTGDSPGVSAVVAVNFATIAADEARGTLLIDTDASTSSVSAALRLRPGAGVMGVVEGRADWGETTRETRIGRDRVIDVVPSGEGSATATEIAAVLQRDIGRLSRQYDAVVLVSTPEQVIGGVSAALPIPDVLVCARAGITPVSQLKTMIDEIAQSGSRTRGIVLWQAPDPVLSDVRPAEPVDEAQLADAV